MFDSFDDEGFADLGADVLWGAFHCDPVADVKRDTRGLVGDCSAGVDCELVDSHLWVFVLLEPVESGIGDEVAGVGGEVVDVEGSFEIFALAGGVGGGVCGAVGLGDGDFVVDVAVVVGEGDVGVFDFSDSWVVGEGGLRVDEVSGACSVAVDESDFSVD